MEWKKQERGSSIILEIGGLMLMGNGMRMGKRSNCFIQITKMWNELPLKAISKGSL